MRTRVEDLIFLSPLRLRGETPNLPVSFCIIALMRENVDDAFDLFLSWRKRGRQTARPPANKATLGSSVTQKAIPVVAQRKSSVLERDKIYTKRTTVDMLAKEPRLSRQITDILVLVRIFAPFSITMGRSPMIQSTMELRSECASVPPTTNAIGRHFACAPG